MNAEGDGQLAGIAEPVSCVFDVRIPAFEWCCRLMYRFPRSRQPLQWASHCGHRRLHLVIFSAAKTASATRSTYFSVLTG